MLRTPHILIVDDVPDNIQVAMNLLREDGYSFSFANDGEKALSLIKKNGDQFDLVLLDVMMPGMDGFEVCRRIKSETSSHQLPIIFLTARSDVDAMTQGFDAGGVDYVTKPFHANELLARVRTHVNCISLSVISNNKM
jgi:putative two-component system response regulator